ncbi:MAG: deoxyribodipyrimidine photolyase, partial [Bacteroidota bacterium]
MTSLEQALYDFVLGRDYPAPLVDLVESAQKARKKIWGHRSNELVIAERKRILKTHVRKKR